MTDGPAEEDEAHPAFPVRMNLTDLFETNRPATLIVVARGRLEKDPHDDVAKMWLAKALGEVRRTTEALELFGQGSG